jgi:hypothetical protein
MAAMRRLLGGHLGASVSALVDGQLDEESAERAWTHVAECPPCRRLVQHETWVKRQVAHIAEATRPDVPSEQLLGSLRHLDPTAAAWADVEDVEDRGRGRRRAGIALVGAGSVSAAVLGLSALSGAGLGGSGVPATSIGRASVSSSPTRAVVAPAGFVHGRLRGWTWGIDANGVAHARAVADRR